MPSPSTPPLSLSGGWTISKDFHVGAGPWLNYKIGTAARSLSRLNNAQLEHAKWLVASNTASISLSEDYIRQGTQQAANAGDGGPAIDWNNMPGVLDRLLQMLIRPEDGRDTVALTSPELVLVLNAHGAWPKFDLRAAVDEAVRQMQTRWGYWPVRVFAGFDIQSGAVGHKGLTLTVLNAVGLGPGTVSMVRALDEKIVEPGWNRVMLRKVLRGGVVVEEFVHAELLAWVKPEIGYAAGLVEEEEDRGVSKVATEETDLRDEEDEDDEDDEDDDAFETALSIPERRAAEYPTWKQHHTELVVEEPHVVRHAKRFATPDSGIGCADSEGDDDPAVTGGTQTDAKRMRFAETVEEEEDDFEML